MVSGWKQAHLGGVGRGESAVWVYCWHVDDAIVDAAPVAGKWGMYGQA